MGKPISCGHCGQWHDSVAAVRACSAQPSLEPPPSDTNTRTKRAPSARPLTQQTNLEPTKLAGPTHLGRSLLCSPGTDIPSPWVDAHRISASIDADDETVDRLHQAWRQRERVVVEWSGPLPDNQPILDEPFHQLAPDTDLPGERLRFAITANAVNILGDTVSFEPIDLAVANGAEVDPSGRIRPRSGDRAWLVPDGGPLEGFRADQIGPEPLVARPHLVGGRLTPIRTDPPGSTAELAPDQMAAVEHRRGPTSIIAPAGSGKTRVLVERTRHLVTNLGVAPSTVCLVAYNRRARTEMAQRLDDTGGLNIRTLNGLALAIATGMGRFATPRWAQSTLATTIDEHQVRRILERLTPSKARRAQSDPLEAWVDALSACRLGLRDPSEIESAFGNDITGFPSVLADYREYLNESNLVDFDEQILGAIRVLAADPDARAMARSVAPILIVDELQDLTPAHLLLIRLLSGPAAEVFAVGDDDQTIYGYSGASPRWLVNFDHYFRGAARHELTINYRCPPAVVEAASNLLTHNRHRVPKTIRPAPERSHVANELVVANSINPQKRLVDRVNDLISNGAAPGDIAILARVNAALLPPAVILSLAGHPVSRPPGVGPNLLQRSGMGAALAWLRLAHAADGLLSSADLVAAVKRPSRGLRPAVVDWIAEKEWMSEIWALSRRLSERDADKVSSVAQDLTDLRQAGAKGASRSELLDIVYDDIGMLGAVSKLDRSQRTARRAAHRDELLALKALADSCPEDQELGPWVADVLTSIPPFDENSSADRITLATVHTTKGLEWPHVIVHDVRGDLFPHSLADDEEEERRVFHVAVTRGRETVLVNGVSSGTGSPPSPFAAQLSQPRATERNQTPPASTIPPQTLQAPPAAEAANTTNKSRGWGNPKARRVPLDEQETARRDALTLWRRETAKREQKAAFLVLGNATLDEIAATFPTSKPMLSKVKGIGPSKLDAYGDDILNVLGQAPG